jgi:predicted Na+-dependent transporter
LPARDFLHEDAALRGQRIRAEREHAAEKVAGKATSALLGILCLLGIGVGFCLAAPTRRDRFMRVFITILGVAALALGAKLLTEGHPRDAVIWIALPYALAAVVALIWRPLAQERSPAVESR